MNKAILIVIGSIGIPTLVNATTGMILGEMQVEAKPQLVIALQDNHPTTGNDSGSISSPGNGLNTTPTNNTGTETHVEDSTVPPPNGQAPGYAPAPPYAPGQTYSPPIQHGNSTY